jgi:hypothetical protein
VSKDGSLFNPKRDSDEAIADSIVAKVTPDRAETIPRGILKWIGKDARPAWLMPPREGRQQT